MKVHELAKELGISSKDLLHSAETAGITGKSASSNLTDAEVVLLRSVVANLADLNTAVPSVDVPTIDRSTESPAKNSASEAFVPSGPYTGKLPLPPRLFKYAKTRGLTLDAAVAACEELGIPNPRDYMELDLDRVQALDTHFIKNVPF